MKGLQFRRLVLVSDTKRLANQFDFPNRLNLVTGKDNSIGKSTLVKSILWAFGCEPAFDGEWKSHDVKALLYFEINGKSHYVTRYQNTMVLNGKKFDGVSGAYSEAFAKLVGFKLKLHNRNDDTELQVPPPAFYFLPFYIDQLKSWSEPWASFEKLGQYSKWKPTVVKYHSGYIGSEHFEIEESICEQKKIVNEANRQIQRIDSAIEVLDEVKSNTSVAVSEEQFDAVQTEIQDELGQFVSVQVRLFEAQAETKAELYELEKQLELADSSINELEQDYAFAVESVTGDVLECPLCGVRHDNSLASRAVLLADKTVMQEQAQSIRNEIADKKNTLNSINSDLEGVREEVARINQKYIVSEAKEEAEGAAFACVLGRIAQSNVTNNVVRTKESHLEVSTKAEQSQKDLKKDQRKLLPNVTRKTLGEFFVGNLIENIKVLGAEGLNLSKVKHPTDYNKLMGGGAAEGTRGLLAYQIAILRQSEFAQNCITAPFIVDTPNQQEQAVHRYEKVVEVIMENVPKTSQIIMCGMENSALDVFASKAHIIELDEHKLLRKEEYEACSAEVMLLNCDNPSSLIPEK
ncbi:AAA family ATPase [Vibrio agarivorans]|uniref:AAA family ATPase n=1 Tax=Vibrio agarivorans TaxID=153622 RepID=UPI0025B41496|nr:AAA family ATPase [Vibrio agarivorans]MDN3661857.1 AAA family ATPase [Vibrio agarivorans]